MSILIASAPTVNPNATRYGLRAPKGGCVVDGRFYRGGCFCRPYQVDNPMELPVVEAKGASYLVESIDAGECGVSAVRMTKLASRESYNVIRTHHGTIECDCPSYTFTHEGKGTCCKHGVAALAHGLLPVAPIPPAVEEAAPEPALASDDESAVCLTDADFRAWKARQAARFTPSQEDDAYQSGYALAFSGVEASPPSEWHPMRSSSFVLGQTAGMFARFKAEDEERAYDAWVEERYEAAFGDPADRIHDAERCGTC